MRDARGTYLFNGIGTPTPEIPSILEAPGEHCRWQVFKYLKDHKALCSLQQERGEVNLCLVYQESERVMTLLVQSHLTKAEAKALAIQLAMASEGGEGLEGAELEDNPDDSSGGQSEPNEGISLARPEGEADNEVAIQEGNKA